MANFTDYYENFLTDGIFRGGALTTAGAAGSTAVVNKVIWTATTAYSLGDIVVPHANMTGAGGKFLLCTTAATSGSTNTLAIGNPGATVTDNATAIWTVISGMPSLTTMYVALFTANPTDTGGGTEVSGGSYARVSIANTLAAWAGTQSAASTTASTGTGGTTSNNSAITFPAPTANWGVVTGFAVFDRLTSGNMLIWGALTTNKTVNNLDPAPSFAISAFTFQVDN